MCAETISRSLASSAASLRGCMSSAAGDACDICATGGKLGFECLEAAVEMIDAMQHGFAFGGKGGDHQRDGCPEVGRHHLGPGEPAHAANFRCIAIKMDIGAQPRKLLNMHEAVFEDRLADECRALSLGHERHELGLEIGRKSRIGLGRNLNRSKARSVATDADALIGRREFDAGGAITSKTVPSVSGRLPDRMTSPPVIATAIA